jgi:hypothetical protein
LATDGRMALVEFGLHCFPRLVPLDLKPQTCEVLGSVDRPAVGDLPEEHLAVPSCVAVAQRRDQVPRRSQLYSNYICGHPYAQLDRLL